MKTFPNGMFITLEGLESSGKSTLSKRLEAWFREQGYDPLLVGEPGGTEYGQQARAVFLANHNDLVPEAEVGLLLTCKAQLLQKRILPALHENRIVICDRYTDTLFAYQHHAKGHSREMMENMVKAFNCQTLPDLTLLLNVEPAVSMRRSWERKNAGGEYSDLDAAPETFHYQVSIGLVRELLRRPATSYAVLNAELDMDTVFQTALRQILEWMHAETLRRNSSLNAAILGGA